MWALASRARCTTDNNVFTVAPKRSGRAPSQAPPKFLSLSASTRLTSHQDKSYLGGTLRLRVEELRKHEQLMEIQSVRSDNIVKILNHYMRFDSKCENIQLVKLYYNRKYGTITILCNERECFDDE